MATTDPVPGAPISANPPTPTTPEPDWTDQVADLVIDQVDKLRDRTTGTILQVARGIVYGVVALFVLVLVLLLTLVFLGRAIDLIPVATWISYTVLGLIGLIAGSVLWSKRTPA